MSAGWSCSKALKRLLNCLNVRVPMTWLHRKSSAAQVWGRENARDEGVMVSLSNYTNYTNYTNYINYTKS